MSPSFFLPFFLYSTPLSASTVMFKSRVTTDIFYIPFQTLLSEEDNRDISSSCSYHANSKSSTQLKSSGVIYWTGSFFSVWVTLCQLPSSLIVCLSGLKKAQGSQTLFPSCIPLGECMCVCAWEQQNSFDRRGRGGQALSDYLTCWLTRLAHQTPGCSICTSLEDERRGRRMREG